MESLFEVKTSKISHELEKLEELHKQNNQLRASLFNLIVYCKSDSRLDFFKTLVNELTSRFPCRVLFIEEYAHKNASELKSFVGAKMIGDKQTPCVICDQIYFRAPESKRQLILHLIYQHALPDLPITLLWGEDPTLENDLFKPLLKMSHRLVFHSECSQNLQELTERLLNKIEKNCWEIADLNWVLLQGWREVFQSIFNSKESIDVLNSSTKLALNYCSAHSKTITHPHFQVHYMHAWLASRLGWKFKSFKIQNEDIFIVYQKESHEEVQINISKQSCPVKAAPGMITSFKVETSLKKSFTFTTQYGDEQIHVQIDDAEKSNSPYNTSFINTNWATNLAKEICYHETSPQYKAMLHVLAQIKGLV